jgi:hypothetical protein
MRQAAPRSAFIATALAACLLATVSCDSILGEITRTYTGPLPDQTPLSGETVIVRSIHPQPALDVLILDRVQYLQGAPHDVNRVVQAVTTDVHAQVQALDLQPGDQLVVSTRFVGLGETGDLREVPDWGGEGYLDYPIGLHALTSVARANP